MANYTPTSTSENNYTKTLQVGDIIYGTAGKNIPITVPAGSYELECYGAQGASGYYSSKGNSYTNVSPDTNYCNYTLMNGVSSLLTTPTSSAPYLLVYAYAPYYADHTQVAIIFNKSGTYKIGTTLNGTTDGCRIYNSDGTEWFRTTATGYEVANEKYFSAGDYIKVQCRIYSATSYGYVQIAVYTPPSFTDSAPQPGGYGGYAYGIITLKKPIAMYLVTGTQSGFNGGGLGATYTASSQITYAGNGGGASDIRIGTNDLYHRVIVGGGGGGSSGYSDLTAKRGGGEIGASSLTAYQATQFTAGTNGSFGQGGNATDGPGYAYGPGGGGGGWYGGGAGASNTGTSANGGGSGYILTASSHKPSGYALDSTYYLSDAITESSTHTGDGSITITVIELASPKFFFFKTENGWVTAEKIFKKTENGWQGGEI